jgi:hypothetical protein
VTSANIIEQGVMSCEVPVEVYGFVKMSVSFDSATWSREIFNFEIQRHRIAGISEAPGFMFGVIAAIIVVVIVFVAVMRKKRYISGENKEVGSSKSKEKMDSKRKGRVDARPRNRVVGP